MRVIETKLEGCFMLEPNVFEDDRGYFFESFNQQTFTDITGVKVNFVQDNETKSSKGVLRGLHYQRGEYAQAKLVSVIKGAVQDVAVDLRPNSKTFGEYVSIVLTAKNKHQLFIPRGFAHGFLVLKDDTIFSYKCDNFYNKESESGIRYNDLDLNIDWQCSEKDILLSEKDKTLPLLHEL